MAAEPPPPAPPPPPPPGSPSPEPEPAPKKRGSTAAWAIGAGLLLLVIVVVVFAVTRGGGDGTFDDAAYPFTFKYPGDWNESDDVTLSKELGGSGLDKRAVMLDSTNGIILERFELNVAIDEKNLDLAKNELDGLITQLDPNASGETGETGGYLSVTYDSVPVSDDTESKLVALFDGDQAYMINCQSNEEHRDDVAAGCQQALDTLEPK